MRKSGLFAVLSLFIPMSVTVAQQKQRSSPEDELTRARSWIEVRGMATAVLLFLAIICVTRLPLAPKQLFSFDDVNFAYAVGNFDISLSQPQPPGYPVFVLEMRVLHWLHFKRPESILLALQVLGSAASCVALFWAGRRICGSSAGWAAALLLAVHPSFWFAGLTSAVRIQLALVSALVAGSCWKAWTGNARAATASGVLLGLGAGARPEIGLLMLPLWAVGVWRSERTWPARVRQGLVMVSFALVWLVPLVIDSGGPARFWHVTWGYFRTQAAGMTSGLFGADQRVWATTLVWVVVWTFCGVLALPLPAVLAWKHGWGMGRDRSLFIWTWLLPGLAFAAGVHAADPGHVLTIVPPVCLLSGHLVDRAAERLHLCPSPFLVPVLAVLPPLLVWLGYTARPEMIPWAIAGSGAAAGALFRFGVTARTTWIPRWQAAVIMALPAVVLSTQIFFQRNWYYAADDRAPIVERIRRDIHSGFRYMSFGLVQDVTNADDHGIRDVLALARERENRAVVVWDRGATDWRKLSYYAPRLPILIVERDMTKIAIGSDVQLHATEFRVLAPPRLILLMQTVPDSFPRVAWRGQEAYVDLPAGQHRVRIGDAWLRW